MPSPRVLLAISLKQVFSWLFFGKTAYFFLPALFLFTFPAHSPCKQDTACVPCAEQISAEKSLPFSCHVVRTPMPCWLVTGTAVRTDLCAQMASLLSSRNTVPWACWSDLVPTPNHISFLVPGGDMRQPSGLTGSRTSSRERSEGPERWRSTCVRNWGQGLPGLRPPEHSSSLKARGP